MPAPLSTAAGRRGRRGDGEPRAKMERRDDGTHLTQEQRAALQQFRDHVCHLTSEEQLQDHFLLQWLRARGFSVNKAEAMFKKSQDWRKVLDVEHILDWEAPEVLVKYSPLGFLGQDRYGGTVLIIPHGLVDIRGLLLSVSKEDYVKYSVQVLERSKALMAEESRRRGAPVCQQTCIFDLDGFSLKDFTWKPGRDAIVELIQVYEANYPELLRVGYVVNAPRVFTIAFAIVKPFLHQETIRKLQIFGTNGWKEALLRDVDPSVLPRHWGGDRVDPDGDERCPSVICLGGPVPKSYYRNNRQVEDRRGMTSVTVPKGGQERVQLLVTERLSVLRYVFDTEDYDIGFGVECEDRPPPLPCHRVDPHTAPKEGELLCEEPGTYTVIFDNSYSYLRAKRLHYHVQLEPPHSDPHEVDTDAALTLMQGSQAIGELRKCSQQRANGGAEVEEVTDLEQQCVQNSQASFEAVTSTE